MSTTAQDFFKEILTELVAEISKYPLIYTPLVIAICITLFAVVLSLYYIYTVSVGIINNVGLRTPLNIDTLEYNVTLATVFFKFSKYNMWLFTIFPIIVFVLLIIMYLLLLVFRVEFAPIIKKMTIFLVLHNTIVLLLYSLFFKKTRYQASAVSSRIISFNNFVCNNIYKKNTKFLNKLRLPKSDIVTLVSTIGDSLNTLPNDINSEDLAKVFYSLHLYFHFHKIGIRNPHVIGALSLFNPFTLLLKKCEPAKYLNRYGTFIEDISEHIKEYLPSNKFNKNSATVKMAFDLCYSWIIQTNNTANSLYPEDALRSFIVLSVITSIIHILSIITTSYILTSKTQFDTFSSYFNMSSGIAKKVIKTGAMTVVNASI